MRRLVALGLLAVGMLPASAQAVPACPGPPLQTRVLASGQGTLESAIVDAKGRLIYTNGSTIFRLDAPGAQPKAIASVSSPGGIVMRPDGTLIVGQGDSFQNGLQGDYTHPASLLTLDPDTGATKVYATGLAMANGVALGPDGTIYGTNDSGQDVDRVLRSGQTQAGWAKVLSGNGAVVDATGRYLYVAQTFQPPAIQRIDLGDPSKITTYANSLDPTDLIAGLDGMTRDSAGRLYVAANGGGQVWRVDPSAGGATGTPCLLLGGLARFPDGPSMVVQGRDIEDGDSPFPATNLYVVTFGGDVIELRDAVPSASDANMCSCAGRT